MVSHVYLYSISGKKKHLMFVTGLIVDIHVSTKKCVTGKNVILHKALPGTQT